MPDVRTEQERKKDRDFVVRLIRDELGDHLIDKVLIVVRALQRGRGISTPAEEFLRDIISMISDGLTPELAAHSVDEFQENFDYMLSDCGKFAHMYPKLVAQATAEAEARAEGRNAS